MPAAKFNLKNEKWATFKQRFKYRSGSGRPINLENCSAKLQVRQSIGSPDTLLELSTANTRIKPLSFDGNIEFDVPADVTGALTFESGIFDLVITYSDGSKERVLEGEIRVVDGVTR